MAETREQTIVRLENLVRKVKIQTAEAAEVECRVFPPQAQGTPFIIEVSVERYSRRVPVDNNALLRMDVGQVDTILMRDLRTAILAVTRLSKRR